MFILKKEFRFEASHRLPNHSGKCQRLHGHSWRMRIEVGGDKLNISGSEAGMLVDYGSISEIVKPLVEGKLDHYHLNDTTGLLNPTSEELARWIFFQLRHQLPLLIAVEVDETCTSSCRYHLSPPNFEE